MSSSGSLSACLVSMRWGMLSTMTASSTPATGRHTGDSVQRSGDSVQRLMDAAVDAFADKGFHATSTRDIAARAHMSPAGVYVHFASKQDLLFQLCRRGHVLALEIVTSARDSAQAPRLSSWRSSRPLPAGT